jgi:hypothetical protein
LKDISPDLYIAITCTSWVLTSFFHLASFYWMGIEGRTHLRSLHDLMTFIFFPAGFYLFLQVQFPLSLSSIKYKHFLVLGCGEGGVIRIPLVFMLLILQAFLPSTCWCGWS